LNKNGEKKRFRYQIKKDSVQAPTTTSVPKELDPNIPFEPKPGNELSIIYIHLIKKLYNSKVRDVLVETIKEEDVVLQRILVMKEKETVMDLVMEVNMMDTEDVREILCVEATIVNNLDIITMKRMIAVKNQDKASLNLSYTTCDEMIKKGPCQVWLMF